MLKLAENQHHQQNRNQPPSGGCVLKLTVFGCLHFVMNPAAFGRLCVETQSKGIIMVDAQPAAFGRLCVETIQGKGGIGKSAQPPSGGCVLKPRFAA